MGQGPRVEAMAGAYVGLADDENAVLLNPAGLANIKGKRLGAFHNSYLAGIGLESISIHIALRKAQQVLEQIYYFSIAQR